MGLHIGVQKHANCFDEVFLGTSFLPQSITTTFDSDNVHCRKEKSVHRVPEVSRDVLLVTRDKDVNQD